MNLRQIIREAIGDALNGVDPTTSLLGGTLTNVNGQITNDLGNLNTILKTQQIDLKNKDSEIKSNSQLKTKLDPTNPQRKGLERQIPEDQKDYANRKKQLADLEAAKKGMEDAQSEIQKQQDDLAAQAKLIPKSTNSNNTTTSILPSLQSPI